MNTESDRKLFESIKQLASKLLGLEVEQRCKVSVLFEDYKPKIMLEELMNNQDLTFEEFNRLKPEEEFIMKLIEDEDGNFPEDFDDFSLDNQNYDCICEFIKLNSSKIKSTVLRKFGDKYDSSPKNGAIYDFLQTLIDKGFLETYLGFNRKLLPQYDPFFSEINELVPSLKIRMNFEPCPRCGFIPTFDVNCCPVCNRNS